VCVLERLWCVRVVCGCGVFVWCVFMRMWVCVCVCGCVSFVSVWCASVFV